MLVEYRLKVALRELVHAGKVSNQTELGRILGYSKSHFSQIMNENEPLPADLALNMEKLFGIRAAWLKSGDGSMFQSSFDLSKHQSKNVSSVSESGGHHAFAGWMGLPMFNVPVTASFVDSYRDEEKMTPFYYFSDPRVIDCEFGALVTGDSMHSEIRHGDLVACQEIVDMSVIVFGHIYYVLTTNGLEACRYINADPEDKNNFLLVARNTAISPTPLPRNMVKKLFRVRAIIRTY